MEGTDATARAAEVAGRDVRVVGRLGRPNESSLDLGLPVRIYTGLPMRGYDESG